MRRRRGRGALAVGILAIAGLALLTQRIVLRGPRPFTRSLAHRAAHSPSASPAPAVAADDEAAAAAAAPSVAASAAVSAAGPAAPARDPYEGLVPLAARDDPETEDGTWQRVRLFEVGGAYPVRRVEDTLKRDDSGAPVVVRRLEMVGNHILVVLRPDAEESDLDRLNARYGGAIRLRLNRPGHYLVAFPDFDPDTVPTRIAAYQRHGMFTKFAEPDYVVRPTATVPNDPKYGELWGLRKIGCETAWETSTGTGGVIVAVIDTGVKLDHEDLIGNLWVNPGEIPGNGIDDDGNGYIDDIHGWDFGDFDSDPTDGDGHGSHVAGTIAAVGNNATGVVGVSWNSRIMALKFMDSGGFMYTSGAIGALHYALDMKARGEPVRVTNNSWGGGGYSAGLRDVINDAAAAGQVFVAAAGNEGMNNDAFAFYPASYPMDNIISVAASSSIDTLASFSNYGLTSVDLAAPGTGILSTMGSGYIKLGGTSMAAPHVAGAAALLWEVSPDLSLEQVRGLLFNHVDPVSGFDTKLATGGRLNVGTAIEAMPPDIQHTPLLNSTNLVNAHVVDAVVLPGSLVLPETVTLVWGTDGPAGTFVTNIMTALGDDRYQAVIPVQPLGTVVYYYLSAETRDGVVARHPADAPDTLHGFEITKAFSLWIEGRPEQLGTVSPDYGRHTLAGGNVVTAHASPFAEATETHRFACDGWVGIGSVPSSGIGASTTFELRRNSALEWQWRSEYSLRQAAQPDGVVTLATWWPEGTLAGTVTAATQVVSGGVTNRFVEWRIDGARRPDADSPAVNPAEGIRMDAAREAVAVFLPAGEDSDGDGLPDWWERHYFGSLAPGPNDDPDGDGYSNLEEFADGSHPQDGASIPEPPGIVHTFLDTPQTSAAPWQVTAVITDNHHLAATRLNWRLAPGVWTQTVMTATGAPDTFAATIPGPSAPGQAYEYTLWAMDGAGQTTETAKRRFRVVHPLASLSPDASTIVLPPGRQTNLLFAVGNVGNTNMLWTLHHGWRDAMETAVPGWEHYGKNSLWKRVPYRAYSGEYAWYCGRDSPRQYINSMNASLVTPPVALASNSVLTFMHWAKIEYDDEQNDDHYWDGGIVELSIDGGSSFAQIHPEGGYPHRITDNPASPFAPDTPCYGGTGGWERARFDLSAYADETVRIRFRFGSDGYVVDEGWYLDDVAIEPVAWLSATPEAGDTPAGLTDAVSAVLDAEGFATGGATGTVWFASNDPTTPVAAAAVTMLVRSPPQVALLSAAQTSTDGRGLVEIAGRLYDADGDVCAMAVAFSTDGAAWHNAWLSDGVVSEGAVSLQNVTSPQVEALRSVPTNLVTVTWNTVAGPAPIGLSTSTWVRLTVSDGLLEPVAVTSQPFMVDNEAPGSVASVSIQGYPPGTYWTQGYAIPLAWPAVSDGDGVGVQGYAIHPTIGGPAPWLAAVDTTATSGVAQVGFEATNWWFGVRAVDAFGNVGDAAWAGPMAVLDADGDFDGDGFSTGAELRAGTDPTDPASGLWFTQAALRVAGSEGPDFVLSWPSVTGRWYSLYDIASLTDTAAVWQISDAYSNRPGSGGMMSHTVRVDGVETRFYRVTVTDNP